MSWKFGYLRNSAQLAERSRDAVRKSYPIPRAVGHGVAIDVGSFVGGFELAYVHRFQKIFYLEACYENYLATLENTRHLENVMGWNLAAFGCSGRVEPFSSWQKNRPSMGRVGHLKGHQTRSCFTINLEDLIDLTGAAMVDFLKVDIEGGESDFLEDIHTATQIQSLGLELHHAESEASQWLYRAIRDFFQITHEVRTHGEHLEIVAVRKPS
jgi:FkbM family methyltransferase